VNSAEQYILDVKSGKQVVCLYVKLAIDRHLNDLKRKDIYFDVKAGEKAMKFFSFLKHSKGAEFAGKEFILSPWQAFIVYSLFGWKYPDGTRRFSFSYTEVAKKNGKSTLAAGIGLYMLVADGEQGAEVYSAATIRDQAKIVFDEAKRMVQKSPDLAEIVTVFAHNLHISDTFSKFEAISSDQSTFEGKNPSCAIVDEYHAHKDDLLLNNIKAATVARRQSLVWIITTAGYSLESPCYRFRKICIDILEGKIHDDSLFAIIFSLDENDDWKDRSVWVKANPNLGIAVFEDKLVKEFQQAVNSTSSEVGFKTKNLNYWVGSASTWISDEKWNQCNLGPLNYNKGFDVWCGLDLASVSDLACFGGIWDENKIKQWKPTFYMPEISALERMKKDKANYYEWVNDGFVKMTSGDTIDYDVIYDDIIAFSKEVRIKSLCYDPWNATQIVIRLQEAGINVVPYPQRVSHMNVPCKTLEKWVIDRTFNHGGNPVMRWMNGNVWVKPDANDNIMINKGKSTGRVDGMVALVMAIGGYITDNQKTIDYNELIRESIKNNHIGL
jgi:phage terminase large subunit-like protein